jgi:uncharacterized protein YqjF (DUF2071 family)
MVGVRPMFLADWTGALFIHFRADRRLLSRVVPFELDLHDGDAFFSLVAFTQSRLRPTIGGELAAWMSSPLAEHEFLNLRAYVRVNGERGIYFVSEWIPNRLAVLIGPRLYGLPYRLGAIEYENVLNGKPMQGRVAVPEGRLIYRAEVEESTLAPAAPGSLDHFLLERYVAYTSRRGICRSFRVQHAPWPQIRMAVELTDASLLASLGGSARDAEMISANFSSGVLDVGISPPTRLARA